MKLKKIILLFLMAFLFTPIVFAEEVEVYDLKVGDESFTSEKLVINGDSGTITYDPSYEVLTLRDYVGDTITYNGNGHLSVYYMGNNKIYNKRGIEDSCGIASEGKLDINSSEADKLEITNVEDGICSGSNLEIRAYNLLINGVKGFGIYVPNNKVSMETGSMDIKSSKSSLFVNDFDVYSGYVNLKSDDIGIQTIKFLISGGSLKLDSKKSGIQAFDFVDIGGYLDVNSQEEAAIFTDTVSQDYLFEIGRKMETSGNIQYYKYVDSGFNMFGATFGSKGVIRGYDEEKNEYYFNDKVDHHVIIQEKKISDANIILFISIGVTVLLGAVLLIFSKDKKQRILALIIILVLFLMEFALYMKYRPIKRPIYDGRDPYLDCEDKDIVGGGFNVIFHTNGGEEIANMNVCVGCSLESYQDLPIPTKQNMVFDGWYYDEELSEKVEATNTYDLYPMTKSDANGCQIGYRDIQLYAKWK